jgi:hypothetical protein
VKDENCGRTSILQIGNIDRRSADAVKGTENLIQSPGRGTPKNKSSPPGHFQGERVQNDGLGKEQKHELVVEKVEVQLSVSQSVSQYP